MTVAAALRVLLCLFNSATTERKSVVISSTFRAVGSETRKCTINGPKGMQVTFPVSKCRKECNLMAKEPGSDVDLVTRHFSSLFTTELMGKSCMCSAKGRQYVQFRAVGSMTKSCEEGSEAAKIECWHAYTKYSAQVVTIDASGVSAKAGRSIVGIGQFEVPLDCDACEGGECSQSTLPSLLDNLGEESRNIVARAMTSPDLSIVGLKEFLTALPASEVQALEQDASDEDAASEGEGESEEEALATSLPREEEALEQPIVAASTDDKDALSSVATGDREPQETKPPDSADLEASPASGNTYSSREHSSTNPDDSQTSEDQDELGEPVVAPLPSQRGLASSGAEGDVEPQKTGASSADASLADEEIDASEAELSTDSVDSEKPSVREDGTPQSDQASEAEALEDKASAAMEGEGDSEKEEDEEQLDLESESDEEPYEEEQADADDLAASSASGSERATQPDAQPSPRLEDGASVASESDGKPSEGKEADSDRAAASPSSERGAPEQPHQPPASESGVADKDDQDELRRAESQSPAKLDRERRADSWSAAHLHLPSVSMLPILVFMSFCS